MGIISANRLSKMNGNFIIAANESYGVNDIGRIMLENERNDMAIFNTALKADMYEIKCRTEGTLLESELQTLSENAVKDFFNKIIEMLKKAWAKIKGVFKKAYAMLTAYCVSNGKAFVAANRKALSDLTSDSVVKGNNVSVTKKGPSIKSLKGKDFSDYAAKIVSSVGSDGGSGDMTKAVIKDLCSKYNEDGSFYEWLKKENFDTKTDPKISDFGMSPTDMITALENGKDRIKELKSTEKEIESSLKDAIRVLENEQRNLANTAKEGSNKQKNASDLANKYKTASTALVNGVSIVGRAKIKIEKDKLKAYRIALGRAIAGAVKTENALFESMMLEAAEEIDDLDDSDSEALTPEEAEEAAAIIAQAAEEMGEADEDPIEDTPEEGCKSC